MPGVRSPLACATESAPAASNAALAALTCWYR